MPRRLFLVVAVVAVVACDVAQSALPSRTVMTRQGPVRGLRIDHRTSHQESICETFSDEI
jgi:hypothetical protein